jgi:N-glycosylase/DNA lyase
VELVRKIKAVKKKVGKQVEEKLREFEGNIRLTPEEKFLELCFCILVANMSLEKTLEAWKNIGKGFLFLSEDRLKEKLKELGYRFYNRAEYIVADRKFIKDLDAAVASKNPREWLVKNVKGIGWKEASHFLRNLGFKDFAILDRHVLKILVENKIIAKPKALTKTFYLETEDKLRKVAEKLGISLAELDLYLFYLDAGKVCER